ncbi:hypothetical protein DPMN_082075 [Dreissena polymorpha]|uniref:Uncharacterized protein n=1 Tax=Dreissena polymorpha TaxID=45954 RepID=A0A9D3YA57_DREPO|nr:hypothetical protein DPMN_082075 [Dreissena polymorpha]
MPSLASSYHEGSGRPYRNRMFAAVLPQLYRNFAPNFLFEGGFARTLKDFAAYRKVARTSRLAAKFARS